MNIWKRIKNKFSKEKKVIPSYDHEFNDHPLWGLCSEPPKKNTYTNIESLLNIVNYLYEYLDRGVDGDKEVVQLNVDEIYITLAKLKVEYELS